MRSSSVLFMIIPDAVHTDLYDGGGKDIIPLLNFDGYGSVCLVAPHTDISACAIYFYCAIVLTALREKNDWIICP